MISKKLLFFVYIREFILIIQLINFKLIKFSFDQDSRFESLSNLKSAFEISLQV